MKSGVSVPQPVSFAVDDTEDVTTLRHLRRQARYFVLSRYHFGLQHKAPKVKRERPAEFELCITSMLFCEFAYNQRLICNIFGVDCIEILTYWFNYVYDGVSAILLQAFFAYILADRSESVKKTLSVYFFLHSSRLLSVITGGRSTLLILNTSVVP